jgi:hypothetical protein
MNSSATAAPSPPTDFSHAHSITVPNSLFIPFAGSTLEGLLSRSKTPKFISQFTQDLQHLQRDTGSMSTLEGLLVLLLSEVPVDY